MTPNPAWEMRTVRRAAFRGGCKVRSLTLGETLDGRRAIGRVDCPDGWAAARMLVAAAEEDARTPNARDLALALRRVAPDDESFARAVHAFVKSRVAFVREAGEVFQGAAYTLASAGGDCDDHARVVYAIATAGGLPAVMAFLHHGGPDAQPTHAVVQLGPHGRWQWAETTIDAHFGEHPLAAAQRLGLLKARGDLAREVLVMKASDLPPVPAGFDDAHDQERIAEDAEALERLGYVPAHTACQYASHPKFREAVARFQKDMGGLVVDGLIGPKTRRRIGYELGARFPGNEFAMGYLGDVDPQAQRIAKGRATFEQAFAEMGIPASAEGKEALMAISWGETRFGDPALGWGDSNNWGAVTYNPTGRGEPFASWGYIEHGDRDGAGNAVKRRFQRYPSALEGAKDKIRIALRTPAAKAAVMRSSGVPEALAAAMFDAKYFEGTSSDFDGDGVAGTRADRIAAYAVMIRGSMATFAKAGGGTPGAVASVSSRAVGAVAVLLGLGAAATWWAVTS